jgi:hypothetical protein
MHLWINVFSALKDSTLNSKERLVLLPGLNAWAPNE